MVLSEAEAEAQLLALRRQREALDRAIADLTLYLELGRRLTAGSGSGSGSGSVGEAASPSPAGGATGYPGRVTADPGGGPPGPVGDRLRPEQRAPWPSSADAPAPRQAEAGAAPARSGGHPEPRPAAPEPRHDDPPGAAEATDAGPASEAGQAPLSEGVLARRYGRALIEAALAILEEAGRPLHAGEILAGLSARGFTLPGHDPVAALNTRLWKRSGPGGPFRRLGDAVYAQAEADEA